MTIDYSNLEYSSLDELLSEADKLLAILRSSDHVYLESTDKVKLLQLREELTRRQEDNLVKLSQLREELARRQEVLVKVARKIADRDNSSSARIFWCETCNLWQRVDDELRCIVCGNSVYCS